MSQYYAVPQLTDKAGFVWRIAMCVLNGLTPRLEGGRNLLVIHSLRFRHRVAYCLAELDEAGDAVWIVRRRVQFGKSFILSLRDLDSQFTKVRLPGLGAPDGSHDCAAFKCNMFFQHSTLRSGGSRKSPEV